MSLDSTRGGVPLAVEVVYLRPDLVFCKSLLVPRGTRVDEAVRASGLLEACPDIDLQRQPLGIWGRRVSPEQLLNDGDRIELYRLLQADPKQARRERARRRG